MRSLLSLTERLKVVHYTALFISHVTPCSFPRCYYKPDPCVGYTSLILILLFWDNRGYYSSAACTQVMAYSHLSASKLPRVRHSIRNTMAREELEMAGISEGGSASGSIPRNSVTSMTPPTIHLEHRERSVKKRISMAAVGHTALGSLLKRGHINSM